MSSRRSATVLAGVAAAVAAVGVGAAIYLYFKEDEDEDDSDEGHVRYGGKKHTSSRQAT